MTTIAERLAGIEERIARATAAAGRPAGAVQLVAVSKTKPAAAIREAYAAGQRHFGENYAQELDDKARELRDLVDLRWHFIGHLQSNKAKIVAPIAALVHTVDSPRLARELAKRSGDRDRVLDVLVEVNVGGETEKHGAAPAEVEPILAAIEAEPKLRLRGLMTIPPADLERARRAFDDLAALRDKLGSARLPELSMGMSDDLEVAIACGATIVRIGTAIFGAREVTSAGSG